MPLPASGMTVVSAFSAQRRRSRKPGRELAIRNFGTCRSTASGARAPVAVALAIALPGAVFIAFTVPSAGWGDTLQRHQAFGGKADHLARETGVRALLQRGADGDLGIGSSWWSAGQSCVLQPNPSRQGPGGRRRGSVARLRQPHNACSGGQRPTAPAPRPIPARRLIMPLGIFGPWSGPELAPRACRRSSTPAADSLAMPACARRAPPATPPSPSCATGRGTTAASSLRLDLCTNP